MLDTADIVRDAC